MPGAVNHVLKEGIFSAEGGNLALHIPTHSIVYARNAIQVGPPPPPSAFSEFMFTQ